MSFSGLPSSLVQELVAEVTETQLPTISNGVLLIPYHYLIIVWSLFKVYKITEDVVPALLNSFWLLFTLQIGYAYLISWLSPQKKKKKVNLLYMMASMVISIASSVPFFVVLILFGAPVLSLQWQTYLLSLHVALMSTFPLLIAFTFLEHDNFHEYITSLIKQFSVKHEIYCSAVGVMVGTWLGCFPIPLDWDRDWQTWPITLLVGGYLGGALGGVIALLYKLIF